ncbi:hypothetical protein ACETK8_10035 [Brevundimonas staleyi]
MTDAEASSEMAGLPLRTFDLLNLLLSRYPDCGVTDLDTDARLRRVTLKAPSPISDAVLRDLTTFIRGVDIDWPIDLEIVAADIAPRLDVETNPMFILASAFRKAAPRHVREDEAFWFDNIEAVARGGLTIDRFPGMKPEAFRCFLDLTRGSGQANLRQMVMLYDEVWCSLPLLEDFDAFLAEQRLTRAELLDLVGSGRLRIVSTQPEERLDIPFLDAVTERAPTALFGRRTTAALLMADVAQTAEISRLNDRRLREIAGPLVKGVSELIGGSPDALMQALFWPLQARRGALQSTLDLGSKAGPALGLGRALAEQIKASGGVDVELELMLFSETVHIGHALNATVYPGLDQPSGDVRLMSMIGQDLNFHRGFNRAIVAAWASNERRRAEGVTVMPPLPLFEFEHVPIEEFLEDTRLGSTRRSGRALMARLADLPDGARADEVQKLVADLRKLERGEGTRLLSFETLDTGLSLAGIIGGFVYPPLAGLLGIGKPAVERLRNIPAVDRFVDEFLDDAAPMTRRNSDLDFLSRIKRVAQFKRSRI